MCVRVFMYVRTIRLSHGRYQVWKARMRQWVAQPITVVITNVVAERIWLRGGEALFE